MCEIVDLGIEDRGPGDGLHPMLDGVDIPAEHHADDETDQRPGEADRGTAHQEDAHHRAASGAECTQHRNVARLILYHHNQRTDHIECGHQDDQRQDKEHDVLLDLHRGKEAVVALCPVDDLYIISAQCFEHGPMHRIDLVVVLYAHLDLGDGVGFLEIG